MDIAMASVLLVVLSALFVVTVASLLGSSSKRMCGPGSHLPPGPKGLPFIGNLHQLSGDGVGLHRVLWHLSLQHGPIFTLKLGFFRAVVISSAELGKEVLKTKDLDFCTRPRATGSDAYSLGGKGIIFSPYGDSWRVVKKLSIVELFSVKKVRSFSAVREEEISDMLQAIAAAAADDHTSQGVTVNISKLVLKLTNNFTCRVAFGSRRELEGRLHHLFTESIHCIIAPYVGDYFPALRWVDWLSGSTARLKKNADGLFGVFEEIVTDHLHGERTPPDHEEDIVDVLLRIQREEGNLTMDDIKALISDIFFAGTETSLSAVLWTLAELIRHPEAMKQAQDEVRKVIGTKKKIEEADILHLRYLNCVIKESFRLHPPVPLLLQRESMRQTSIAGYNIPQGTRVFVNAWAIGRDAKSWREPDDFIPERFMEGKHDIDFKGQDFKLIPFGSGRRVCPGMHFGVTTVEHVLANLLYWFDWRVPDGIEKDDINMDETLGITVQKKIPLELVPIKPMLG